MLSCMERLKLGEFSLDFVLWGWKMESQVPKLLPVQECLAIFTPQFIIPSLD